MNRTDEVIKTKQINSFVFKQEQTLNISNRKPHILIKIVITESLMY